MKLHWSPRSPFVRKVMVMLHETGLLGRVQLIRSVVAMSEPNLALMRDNPLGQIPTLVLDDGSVLYDSPVICEYLDAQHMGARFFPAGERRWVALRRQAQADGLLATLLLWRQERMKPEQKQTTPWLAGFELKTTTVLDALEGEADALGADAFDIGLVSIGCALSYLDFRFSDIDWRDRRPRLAAWHASFTARPSVVATEPDPTSP